MTGDSFQSALDNLAQLDTDYFAAFNFQHAIEAKGFPPRHANEFILFFKHWIHRIIDIKQFQAESPLEADRATIPGRFWVTPIALSPL